MATKRNHYNPCFWTAYWDPIYYKQAVNVCSTTADGYNVREQTVYALSVKSGKIFQSRVENIHFDKHLGVAEITREAAEEFCKRHHPDRYEQFLRENASAPYPVYIDFEEILTAIENMPPYRVLLDVIQRQDIVSREEKSFLGCFIYIQLIRSHAIMNSMIEMHAELGWEKFEYFVLLKWMLEDVNALFKAIYPLVRSHWTLYATDSDIFPLCDSPILIKPGSIMAALSPRLMLELLPNIPAGEDQWEIRRTIDIRKLTEFRHRTIGNTFREIIFGHKSILKHWRATPEFQNRLNLVRDLSEYNSLVEKRDQGELWLINAFANR